jgi:hypothetical protein
MQKAMRLLQSFSVAHMMLAIRAYDETGNVNRNARTRVRLQRVVKFSTNRRLSVGGSSVW